jgi:putative aldouronate transport system substrate-binding protein
MCLAFVLGASACTSAPIATSAAPAATSAAPAATTAPSDTTAPTTEASATATEPATAAPAYTTTTKLTWLLLAGSLNNEKWNAQYPVVVKYLKDNLGVEFDLRDAGGIATNEVFQTMVASGQMCDIYTTCGGVIEADIAAKADLLLDLNTKKDQLPNLFTTPIFSNMVKYLSDTNAGKLNYLFSYVGKTNLADSAPKVRWDLYEKLGTPDVNTVEDLIPLFKKMKELEPTRADGSKTYGMGFFPSWDGAYGMSFVHYMECFYGRGYAPNFFVEQDGDKLSSRISDGSIAYRMLKFYYEMNQAGLLDPDSFTQTWEAYDAKMTNGNYFFAMWPWHGGNNITKTDDLTQRQGYELLLIKDATYPINPDNPVGNTSRIMALGAKAPDAALRFLDFVYSSKGTDYIDNSEKGLFWDVGSDGTRAINDAGKAYEKTVLANPDYNNKIFGLTDLLIFEPINGYETNAEYNDYYNHNYWPGYIKYTHEKEADPLYDQWVAKYGAIDLADFVAKSGKSVKINSAVSFMPAPSDDMQQIMTQVGDVWKTNSYKMIAAKNQAEFDNLWKETKTKCDQLGLQKILDWTYGEWDKAVKLIDQYSK